MSEISPRGEWLGMDEAKVVCLPFVVETEDSYLISKLPDSLVPCLNMGVSQSKKTPLQCMLDNYKGGYTGDYSVELTSQKLWRFCQIDWVSFRVDDLPGDLQVRKPLVGSIG
jgi:hypothetical protein